MGKIVNGFHHVALNTTCFDDTIKFYTEGLGLTVDLEWGGDGKRAAMLGLGDGSNLEIFEAAEKQDISGGYVHLAYNVDDTDAAYNCAIAAGAKSQTEPKSLAIPAKSGDYPIRIAFVVGPNDEVIEFFHVVK